MGLFALTCLAVLSFSSAATVIHEGGSCGPNAIPYKMVVDAEGKPELFCETPTCFGIDYSPKTRRSNSKEMIASCDPFKEVVCVDELQWTGGLLEINNGTHRTLKTECCSYDGMASSQTIKSIFLGPGDVYIGGLVEKNGEVGGFDLIKEVRKTVNAENQVQYIVGVFRLPCMASSDSSDELPVLSRNKRKLHDRVGKNSDYDEESYRPLRRRPFGSRRRAALLQRLEDYYDYDYDFPALRRPFRRSRLPYANNRLWPVEYAKPRAYAESIYGDKGSLTVESGGPQGPLPPPQSASYIESQNIAPANSYIQQGPALQNQPVPPPADTYASSYSAYPSDTANQYAGYPAQQPAYQQVYQPAYQPAAQPSYSYPAYNPGYSAPNLNGLFSRTPFQCFSGDMEVETEEGPKLIKDLVVGDRVLTMDEAFVTYAPVIMFLHKRDNEYAEFNHIETEHGHSIKLTDNHLIYVSNCGAKSDLKLVAAKDVKVNDCIHVTTDKNTVIKKKVSKLAKIAGTGIYSPLTSTGDIIVNRVLASCHSNLALKSLQQTFFSLYKRTSNVFNNLVDFKSSPTTSDDGHLPFGVETITSVMGLFIPQSFV